jgi:hypothetical protein
MLKNQRGFAHALPLLIILTAIIGGSFLFVRNHQHKTINKNVPAANKSTAPKTTMAPKTEVNWFLGDGGIWSHSGTPPACPAQPILATPVDLSLVTSILYPGQVRGNAFKSHGGFRFDNQPNNDIVVKVPLDAKLLRGSKGNFTENGEVQYGFEFLAPCGIWYSFGHLHTLSPQFQAYADKLPLITDHSQQQLYDIDGSPIVKKADVIATQVGIVHTKNVFVELEVQDLRQPNGKTIRPAWAKYADQFDKYAICWLDWLPPQDAIHAHALPGGDSVSGKQSDYCN